MKLSPYTWAIRQGLYEAANNPSGTSYPVFAGFPIKVAGKTGTAETCGVSCPDHSWYASWAPYDHPKLVVVAMIEQRRLRRPGRRADGEEDLRGLLPPARLLSAHRDAGLIWASTTSTMEP